MFPLQRNRRLRKSPEVRALVREHMLTVDDFIVPLFVVEGTNVKEEIPMAQSIYQTDLKALELEEP